MKRALITAVVMAGVAALAQEIIPLPAPVSIQGSTQVVVATNTVQITGLRVTNQQYMGKGDWSIMAMALDASNRMVRPISVRVLGTEITNHTKNAVIGNLTVDQLQAAVTEIAFAKAMASLTNTVSR